MIKTKNQANGFCPSIAWLTSEVFLIGRMFEEIQITDWSAY